MVLLSAVPLLVRLDQSGLAVLYTRLPLNLLPSLIAIVLEAPVRTPEGARLRLSLRERLLRVGDLLLVLGRDLVEPEQL